MQIKLALRLLRFNGLLDFLLVALREEDVAAQGDHRLVVLLVDLVAVRVLVEELGPRHPDSVRSMMRF